VLVIDEVQGRFLFSATPEIGRRWPIHATSTGKVLLAFAQTTRSLPRLAKHGPRTITTHAELDRELERVRQHGYAFAVDELETGLVAMAAPIKNHLGHVVAAVSLNGPSSRLTPKRRRQLQAKLCAAAKRVSRRLGATTAVGSASNGHRAEIAL
jgi:DNA-binding IclR family transcriptional regulator